MWLRVTATILASTIWAGAALAQAQSLPGGGFMAREGPGGCLIAWIDIDRGRDGLVTRRDVILATDSEFANLDADPNGRLTRAEWTACDANPVFSGSFPPLVFLPDNAGAAEPWTDDAAFDDADADDDGEVTREEATAAQRARYEGLATEVSATDVARSGGRKFLLYDQNGDGTLTASEWSGRASADVGSRFRRFDLDGDNEIHIDEWRGVVRATLLESDLPDGSIDIWPFYFWF